MNRWTVQTTNGHGKIIEGQFENIEQCEHTARAWCAMFRQRAIIIPPEGSGLAIITRMPVKTR